MQILKYNFNEFWSKDEILKMERTSGKLTASCYPEPQHKLFWNVITNKNGFYAEITIL